MEPVTTSSPQSSADPFAMNRKLILSDEQEATATVLDPPLPRVSVDINESECEHIGPAAASGERWRLGGTMTIDDGDNTQDLPDPNTSLGSVYGKPRRRLSWPSRTDLKRFARETQEREVEKDKDMSGSELEPNKGNKRERRRIQNQLAQRAFRARSNIHKHEIAGRLSHLEALNVAQAGRLVDLGAIVDGLQCENKSLKRVVEWTTAAQISNSRYSDVESEREQ